MMSEPTTTNQWHELITMIMAFQADLTSFLEDNHTSHPTHVHDLIGFSLAMDSIYLMVTELTPTEAKNSYEGYDPEIFMTRLRERIYKIVEQTKERLEAE